MFALGAPVSPCPEAAWEPEEHQRDSLEEMKSSRSVCGKNFPDFEMLDAKIASALSKIIPNSHFKKKVSFEEQEAQKQDLFIRGGQIAFMIYDHFRVIGVHHAEFEYADLFTVTCHDDTFQEFDARYGTTFYYQCQRFPPMICWEVCTN